MIRHAVFFGPSPVSTSNFLRNLILEIFVLDQLGLGTCSASSSDLAFRTGLVAYAAR